MPFTTLQKKIVDDLVPRIERGSFDEQLVLEMFARLGQLDVWLELEAEAVKGIQGKTAADRSSFDSMDRAVLFAEAFYVFAFRVVDIARKLNRRLFSKRELVQEPMGIVNNRNNLIIHPPDPVLSQSFMFSSEKGIHLKHSAKPGAADFQDAGFVENLEAFDSFIHQWVDAAVAATIAPPA